MERRSSTLLQVLWMNESFHLHLPLCLNTFKALCMNFIYIAHINFVAVWFVHLGNHFTSSWVYGWIFFLHHQNRVKWILHVRHQVELVYEWSSSWLSFYSLFKFGDDHVCALSKIVPSNCSSMYWIVVLVRFVYGLVLYTIFVRPWFERLFLRFHLVLSFRRMYFRFILHFIFPFKESLWTIHPCIQGFYSSMLVCLSWITLDECTKMMDSHTIMYILENTSYIYISLKIQTYSNIRL